MNLNKTIERLAPAIAHEFDREKVFAAEKERNRVHNEKFKGSIRASMKRRMANPRHQASVRPMSRVGWLIRHPDLRMGIYPAATRAMPMGELLGCKAIEFKKYIESQFHSGMTWYNYGTLWHVGHRLPVRFFDCREEAQLKACFNYRNLQPELPDENMRKMNEQLA